MSHDPATSPRRARSVRSAQSCRPSRPTSVDDEHAAAEVGCQGGFAGRLRDGNTYSYGWAPRGRGAGGPHLLAPAAILTAGAGRTLGWGACRQIDFRSETFEFPWTIYAPVAGSGAVGEGPTATSAQLGLMWLLGPAGCRTASSWGDTRWADPAVRGMPPGPRSTSGRRRRRCRPCCRPRPGSVC